MNIREKIIRDNLEYCEEHKRLCTERELSFIKRVHRRRELTQAQFNKLNDIVLQLHRRKFREMIGK